VNGWLINIMRLKRILRTDNFAGERVLAATARLFAKGAEAPKWKQLAALCKRLGFSPRDQTVKSDRGPTSSRLPSPVGVGARAVFGAESPCQSQIMAELGQRTTRPQRKNFVDGRSHINTIHCILNALKSHVLKFTLEGMRQPARNMFRASNRHAQRWPSAKAGGVTWSGLPKP
jgi:hypothetical protein